MTVLDDTLLGFAIFAGWPLLAIGMGKFIAVGLGAHPNAPQPTG